MTTPPPAPLTAEQHAQRKEIWLIVRQAVDRVLGTGDATDKILAALASPRGDGGGDVPSHLGPTCDKLGRRHIWQNAGETHRICIECKIAEPRNFIYEEMIAARDAAPPASAAGREAVAWQPIETAPRDGTEVQLAGMTPNGPRVTAGFWLVPEPRVVGDCGGECRCPEYADPEDPVWMSNDGGFCEPWPATHWKPLSAHPSAHPAPAPSGRVEALEAALKLAHTIEFRNEGGYHALTFHFERDEDLNAAHDAWSAKP